MKIAIINGPNLNLLGKREPYIYGNESFETYLAQLREDFSSIELLYYQSNVEGEVVNQIQQWGFEKDIAGLVLNAGAYSHTSIAIADAIAAVETPVISVHISNIFSRETERKTDLPAAKSVGHISGLGLEGYKLAILWLIDRTNRK